MPSNLTERIDAGVITLARIPRAQLIAWSQEATRQCDKDALGDAIMYGERDG